MNLSSFRRVLSLDIGQLWLASIVSNALFYVFHVIVGRSLGPKDYSLFGALMGLLYLAGALSSSVQVSVAKLVAEARASGNRADEPLLISTALFQMALLSGTILVAFSLASPLIGGYLHSETITPILITGLALFALLLLPVLSGALQGAQRFAPLALFLLISAAGRLLFGLGALRLDMGVNGALSGVGIASVLTVVVGLAAVRPARAVSFGVLPTDTMLKLLLPTVVASLALSIPTTVDVIIVRNLFSGTEAGLYTAAAVLGRAVLFLAMPVVLILFPKFAEDWTVGSFAQGLLYRGLALTALLSGVAAVALAVAPRLALTLFVGSQYNDAANIVPIYAGAMFCFSLVIVFLYYHLAIGQMSYVYVVLVPHIVLELAFLYVFHQSLTQVALVLLIANASLLGWSALSAKTLQSKPRSTERLVEHIVPASEPWRSQS